LLGFPWLLFTSRSGVTAWQALGLSFLGPRVGAVGTKTAAALRAAGAEVHLTGEPQTAEGLAQSFLSNPDTSGPVGLPRGNRALTTLQHLLEGAGIAARPVIVYDTITHRWPLEQGEVDVVVLASPSAAEALPQQVGEHANVVALGPSTRVSASARGFTAQQAEAPTATAVLSAIERLVRS
jgi:uroporphyrinogen-III synthase